MPKIILLALFLALSSATAFAQTLWRDTTAGMSLAEVKRLVPEAAPPDGEPGSLAGGAVELLRVPRLELVNQQFAASFYFHGDKLTQVTLSLLNTKTFDSALLTFDSLTEALRAKYGPELGRNLSRQPMSKAEATWLYGRTNINLLVFSVAPGHLVFNLNYQVRIAREADKL